MCACSITTSTLLKWTTTTHRDSILSPAWLQIQARGAHKEKGWLLGCISLQLQKSLKRVSFSNKHMHPLTWLRYPPPHTHTSRPYKHMDVHQRVGLLSSRSGQQQVFHPKKRTYQGSLSPEQLDTSCLNTLTRWADSVSCCGGCLCSFSRSWTGSVNKVSALLCLSLREQPGRSHWRLRHQPRSQYKNWYVFCFFLHKNTSLSSAYRGLLQQIESHPYQKRWISLPKMLMGSEWRTQGVLHSQAVKHGNTTAARHLHHNRHRKQAVRTVQENFSHYLKPSFMQHLHAACMEQLSVTVIFSPVCQVMLFIMWPPSKK